jgi:hypothetical protein
VTVPGQPRVLDASALVELTQGHPKPMRLLDDAHAGSINVLLPAVAVAEAQAALRLPANLWDHIFRLSGVVVLDLTGRNAVEVGALASSRLVHHPTQPVLTGPLMVGHVLREAIETNAVVITRVPELYGGHDVSVTAI